MSANTLDSVAYTYDGTLEGLLSAVFTAYRNHLTPEDIMAESTCTPRLGQTVIPVETDMEAAVRVQRGILKSCGTPTFNAVAMASLSSNPDAGTIIYTFIRHALQSNNARGCARCKRKTVCRIPCGRAESNGALNDIAHPAVAPFYALRREVSNEVELMKQFVRFEHMQDDTWFARISPKCNVVALVMDWFAARFNSQNFMIYDEAHHMAGVYESHRWHLVRTDGITLPPAAEEEQLMQTAWRQFYRALTIDERYNPELRVQFMPKRLWANLTELQEDRTTIRSRRRAV